MTNTNSKLTKRAKFEMLANLSEVKANSVLAEFIAHEIDLLDKKNASKKPTEKQTANEGLKGEIVKMAKADPNRLFTITDFLKALNDPELTNQRVSAIVRQMYDAKETGEVFPLVRIEEKRKAYFKLNAEWVGE